MAKKAVVLFSGGLDSTTVLALAKSEHFQCNALSFNYKQKHNAELKAAKLIAKKMEVVNHKIVDLNLSQFKGSSLTDSQLDVADANLNSEVSIPQTYVPARNTIFLSIALGYAESIGANDIFLGISAVDYSGYPDCRPEYLSQFQKMANLATKSGVMGEEIKIHAPLIYLSKAETLLLGKKLGVDYKMTVSCYRANSKGQACGLCDSCVLRRKGFDDAGIKDETIYAIKL